MQHPTGKFAATIISAQVAESNKKGTPGVFFTFKTSHGEIEGSLWLSDAAYERTLKTIRECFAFNDDFASLGSQIEGKECSITVDMETGSDGKEYARVKWINPVKPAAKPVSGSLLATLTARAKGIAAPVPKNESGEPF